MFETPEGNLKLRRADLPRPDYDLAHYTSRKALTGFALVFISSYLFLFLGMSRRPNIYDEGLVLTAAMRVAVGQIPHRDFYANYGPAQFYILAGLFKVFGESLLVERIFDFFVKALVVTAVYAIALVYCRRSIAFWTSIVTVFWLFGLSGSGSTIIPVSLLNLTASALIVPVFVRNVSARRMFAAGALAGTAALFRYDTGVALLGIEACAIAISVYLRFGSNRLRTLAGTFWPCLLGFAVVIAPPALYYLSVAPLHPLIHDIVIYPSKYYYRGRNLPFPGITLIAFENFALYVPIGVILVSFYVAFGRRSGGRTKEAVEEQRLRGFLITFGLLALVMYFKGYVRIGLAQMFLAIVPSFLLMAVLVEHRLSFSRLVRWAVWSFVWLSVIATTWSTLHVIKLFYLQHLSLPERLWTSVRGASPGMQKTWCGFPGPLTEGICFLPDDERIQVIEFIESHTTPNQRLYVGSERHDKIFANDNLIYFATQRLPATRWSHFDPDLQNRYDIQTQMVKELEANAPPYIVLDSEFALMNEANDSSKSSGVTLLDNYLHSRYRYLESFGNLSIWQRSNAP